jgi:hypothetical protein
MSNVRYLTTGYLPTHEEWVRLESWQRQLSLWRAELSYQQREKGLTEQERLLSKAIFHNSVRSNWKVYEGGKNYPVNPSETQADISNT